MHNKRQCKGVLGDKVGEAKSAASNCFRLGFNRFQKQLSVIFLLVVMPRFITGYKVGLEVFLFPFRLPLVRFGKKDKVFF